MAEVEIYTTATCPYCDRAKQLLIRKNVSYHEIRIDNVVERRDEMVQRSGRRTVPQIFINGKSIGGSDDLYELERRGELDILLR
jgi:glutaredoxin 3